MSSHDWVLILIGAAISVPIALLAPFGSDRIGRVLATRTKRKAQRRISDLDAEHELITTYRKDNSRLQEYLLGQLFRITLLWIGGTAFEAILSGAIDLQYGMGFSVTGNLTGGALALIDSVFLTIVLMIGMRAYRVYRNVRNYDSYTASVDQELGRLKRVT